MPSGSTYASMRLCTESAPNKVDFGIQGGAWAPGHVVTVQAGYGGHMIPSPCSFLDIKVHFKGGIKVVVNI